MWNSLLALALLTTSASAKIIRVEAGEDYNATCLAVVQPGDECILEKGNYYHNGLTITHGEENARITISGEEGACLKGKNDQDRLLQIAHDYYTVKDLCFDGDLDGEYMATAVYVLGGEIKSTKNGVTSSVTGFRMTNVDIKNFSGECVHLRYFVTHAEVSECTIENCGISSFQDGGGGKVGEAIYIGTGLDNLDDGKAPEVKLYDGSPDSDYDVCAYNHIHHNTFRTYGNECVDLKEASTFNLIEHNVCSKQMDEKSGCFSSRGSENTVRWNQISDCVGAGVRVGGEDGYGEGNNIYGNDIADCEYGAFAVNSDNQGIVCENTITGINPISYGNYDQNQVQFTEEIATGDCSSYPGDLDHVSEGDDDGGSATTSTDDTRDDDSGTTEEGDDVSSSTSPPSEGSDDDGSETPSGGDNQRNGVTSADDDGKGDDNDGEDDGEDDDKDDDEGDSCDDDDCDDDDDDDDCDEDDDDCDDDDDDDDCDDDDDDCDDDDDDDDCDEDDDDCDDDDDDDDCDEDDDDCDDDDK